MVNRVSEWGDRCVGVLGFGMMVNLLRFLGGSFGRVWEFGWSVVLMKV